MRSARESAQALKRQWRLGPNVELPSTGLVCRLVVPGWPQIHDGQTRLGRSLLLGFGIFALAAMACLGSAYGSVLLGLAFSCHGISVYEVARRSTPVPQDRIFRTMLGCGLLAAILYLPAYSLASHFFEAVVVQRNSTPLLAGDVLLLRRSSWGDSNPQAGDVVQYRISNSSVMGHTPDGRAARYMIEGARIDRVLAGPTQVIDWDGVKLTVDGQASAWLPLNPGGARQPLSFTVPTDSWLILPSTDLTITQAPATDENWKMWSTVRTEQIDGRIIWRSWPWSRIGFIRD